MITLNVEIVLIFLLIVLNGVLAMAEIAIVSARKIRLQQLSESGDVGAALALELARDPNRFLSTIQIGITLVGVLAGAFGGATVARKLSALLSGIPALDPYSDALGVGLVVFAITYFSLVFGELVPKRIGLQSPERIATLAARPMKVLSEIGKPAVFILSASTNAVLKTLGFSESTEPPVTEEEIRGLIRQGAETGVLDEVEQGMVERVLRLGDRPVSALMTPRTQIEAIDLEDGLEDNLQLIRQTPHSIYPVCEGSLDQVVGLLHVKDLLLQSLSAKGKDLAAAVQPAVFVPETMPALKVLTSFQSTGKHIALVTDEYGLVQGLVTMTDILEAVVGDIPTPDELLELQIVQREDGSWLLDGLLPLDQFKTLLGLEQLLPEEEKGHFHTLGGFVMTYLERIPEEADSFEWGGLRFEVVDMDGNRVDKVLVSVAQP